MPIQYIYTINGVEQKIKWACESCINGHRSTNCEHFSQWMLQVGPTGRPKVKCPHPGPPCPCKRKEKYLMVLVGRNAKGECICQPFRAGQSREESTFMVTPFADNPPLHQGPQMGMSIGQNLYGGSLNNREIGVSQSASGNNTDGPLMEYQHSALGALPPQNYPPQAPPQSIPTQAQAYARHYPPWNPAQGYLPQGIPQGSAQAVRSSWPPPVGYHQAPPAPNHYGGPSTIPLGQGHTHQHLDPTPLPTPEQTPPPTYGNCHSHPHLSPGQQSLDWGYQSFPPDGPQPHTSGDQYDLPYQHSGGNNNHGPLQGDDFINNDYHQPQESLGFDPCASSDGLNQPFTNGHSQYQSGMHQSTGISNGNCQCGPDCNCVRCLTHPTNSATTEWLWGLHDKMAEDLSGGSAPTSRPQSSYGQPSSALNTFSPDMESQAQSLDLAMGWNDYSVLEFPIGGCSNDADCLCGENCRCEGCLTHSGHMKL